MRARKGGISLPDRPHLARLGNVVVDLPKVLHRRELRQALHAVCPLGARLCHLRSRLSARARESTDGNVCKSGGHGGIQRPCSPRCIGVGHQPESNLISSPGTTYRTHARCGEVAGASNQYGTS